MRNRAGIVGAILSRSKLLRAIFEPYLHPRARKASGASTAPRRYSIPTGIVNGQVLFDYIPDPSEPNPLQAMLSPEEWDEIEREALAGKES